MHAFGLVLNGVMLSGYNIRATYDEVPQGADVYVIFTAGEVEDEVLDLSPEVIEPLEQEELVVLVAWGTGYVHTRW